MREEDNIPLARHLRRRPTDAENRLWYLFRDRRLDGIKFRRQHAIGPFVADFVCLEQQLVLEVDGGQHASLMEKDGQRTAYLEKEGFTVLRFWNNEVLENTEAVLETILRSVSPHPNPLPHAGEGTPRPSLQGNL